MKFKLLVLLVLVVNIAHSRQYIQCAKANSWDRAVINLNGDQSTLFMTNGVHLPDELRVLKDLYFVEEVNGYHFYETEGEVVEQIVIANEYIGKALSSFPVEMTMTKNDYSQTFEMSCFSSVYED